MRGDAHGSWAAQPPSRSLVARARTRSSADGAVTMVASTHSCGAFCTITAVPAVHPANTETLSGRVPSPSGATPAVQAPRLAGNVARGTPLHLPMWPALAFGRKSRGTIAVRRIDAHAIDWHAVGYDHDGEQHDAHTERHAQRPRRASTDVVIRLTERIGRARLGVDVYNSVPLESPWSVSEFNSAEVEATFQGSVFDRTLHPAAAIATSTARLSQCTHLAITTTYTHTHQGKYPTCTRACHIVHIVTSVPNASPNLSTPESKRHARRRCTKQAVGRRGSAWRAWPHVHIKRTL